MKWLILLKCWNYSITGFEILVFARSLYGWTLPRHAKHMAIGVTRWSGGNTFLNGTKQTKINESINFYFMAFFKQTNLGRHF